MKNKKLFAILTLVCFMFTLMPVAAFAADTTVYAEVDSEDAVVRLDATAGASVTINMTNPTGNYYVYAVDSEGNLYDGLTGANASSYECAPDGIRWFTGATAEIVFNDEGEYTVYVTPVTPAIENVVKNDDFARTDAQVLALLLQEKVKMLDNAVSVKPAKSAYEITFTSSNVVVDATKKTNTLPLDANSGFDVETVEVQLMNTETDSPVVGATLKISTNSFAVDTNKVEVKTNAAGKAKFDVTASTAGDFKVYVEYGTRADATLDVNAGHLKAANINTLYEPTAPIALYSPISAAEVTYSITDANGNVVEAKYKANGTYNGPLKTKVEAANAKNATYKVTVTEKPAGSTLEGDDLVVRYNPTNAVWYLTSITDAAYDEEGTYTFKVTLDNGNYATAKVTVKEFQSPVELKIAYKQNTVELDGEAVLNKLYYVDANGVTKSLIDADTNKVKEVVLSANGYAIDAFSDETGKVTVKADEKYVGSLCLDSIDLVEFVYLSLKSCHFISTFR